MDSRRGGRSGLAEIGIVVGLLGATFPLVLDIPIVVVIGLGIAAVTSASSGE